MRFPSSFQKAFLYCLFCLLSVPFSTNAQTVGLGDNYALVYKGAIRLKRETVGVSRIAYTTGQMAIDERRNKLFIAGHAHHYAVGEYDLPTPVKTYDLTEMPMAEVTQGFVSIAPDFTVDGRSDRIVGMEVIDGQLFVTTDEYYDANENNEENLVVFNNASDIASRQTGYYHFTGASHAAGWIAQIPEPLSNELGELYLAGSASNIPINSRHSIGPTFFGFYPYYLNEPTASDYSIVTTPYIDFSLQHRIYAHLETEQEQIELWNEISKARYGFISPDQQKYIIIGTSGGIDSGIGYKITQDNGNLCGGFCAYAHDDYYNYYWIFDVEDILKVKNGQLLPHEVIPSQYGKLPINTSGNLLIGADFNHLTNELYLLIGGADDIQNQYETVPILMTYELKRLCAPTENETIPPEPEPEPIQCIIDRQGNRKCF